MGIGALAFMVIWGMWMACDHLGDVFRKAFDEDVDVGGAILRPETVLVLT